LPRQSPPPSPLPPSLSPPSPPPPPKAGKCPSCAIRLNDHRGVGVDVMEPTAFT
jgi:hypothetical protein